MNPVLTPLCVTTSSTLHTAEDHPSTERRELIFLKKSLWTRGSAYPPPDSHVLRLPFRFHLPADPKILPSVFWDYVVITYYVEAIALRPRTFFAIDKRIRERLAVVSRGDPTLCASIRSLGEMQGGPTWKRVHKEKQVRRGMWGEYSTARVEVSLSSVSRRIPHRLTVCPSYCSCLSRISTASSLTVSTSPS